MVAPVKRRRGFTRVSGKHQVTLPAVALTEAGILAGDVLRVEADGTGALRLSVPVDPLDGLVGAFPGLHAAADLDATRNEWDQ